MINIVMAGIDQIKMRGTSLSAAYILSFSSSREFVKGATADGFYAQLDEKDRKAVLAEAYRLAKQQFGKVEPKDVTE